MTLLRKFALATALMLTTCFASQAITIEDFYKYCSKLPNKTEVKIPKLLLKLKNRNLSQLSVITIEDLSKQNRAQVLSKLNTIEVSKDASVIRDNDGDDTSIVHIQPDKNGKDITMLVSAFDDEELNIVYIRCNKKVMDEFIEEYTD